MAAHAPASTVEPQRFGLKTKSPKDGRERLGADSPFAWIEGGLAQAEPKR